VSAQALAQRVLGHERFEFADDLRMAAQNEICVDPRLGAGEPKLLETSDLRLSEPLEPNVGERRATPEPERAAESLGRARGVSARQLGSARRQELLEAI
jgi:hypothetical protein